jgi:hypothetical protein
MQGLTIVCSERNYIIPFLATFLGAAFFAAFLGAAFLATFLGAAAFLGAAFFATFFAAFLGAAFFATFLGAAFLGAAFFAAFFAVAICLNLMISKWVIGCKNNFLSETAKKIFEMSSENLKPLPQLLLLKQ